MADDFIPNRRWGRNKKGQWLRGVSGNPYGRPPKYKMNLDDANPRDFSLQTVSITLNGKPVRLSRRAALNHKLFETAMRSPMAIRTLIAEIMHWSMMQARAQNRLNALEWDWTLNRERKHIPEEVEAEIHDLRRLVSRGATDAPFGKVAVAEMLRKDRIRDRLYREMEALEREEETKAKFARKDPDEDSNGGDK